MEDARLKLDALEALTEAEHEPDRILIRNIYAGNKLMRQEKYKFLSDHRRVEVEIIEKAA